MVDEEEGPLIFTIVENHFLNIERLKSRRITSHRPSLIPLVRRASLVKELLEEKLTSPTLESRKTSFEQSDDLPKSGLISPKNSRRLSLQQALDLSADILKEVKNSEEYQKKLIECERKSFDLAPEVEGRIKIVKF